MARTIHQGIAGSELLILKDAAHLSNLEQAAAFNEAVLLSRVRVSAASGTPGPPR
jgi:pimeloyl-ACP methyl ester carboxylesterase